MIWEESVETQSLKPVYSYLIVGRKKLGGGRRRLKHLADLEWRWLWDPRNAHAASLSLERE